MNAVPVVLVNPVVLPVMDICRHSFSLCIHGVVAKQYQQCAVNTLET